LSFRRLAALALGVALAVGSGGRAGAQLEAGRDSGARLYVWLHAIDRAQPNFLAVVDADAESASYGEVLATVPAGEVRGHAHHTSLTMPRSGMLFANDFAGGHTYLYDTNEHDAPVLRGGFGRVAIYTYAHSFSELPNGNMLVTFQSKREGNRAPGGLVEMTAHGELVQAADAAPSDPRIFVRPYGMEILPLKDRVVVTTYDMKMADVARHVQIWRLSDLRLLQTVPVPAPEGSDLNGHPFEARLLADGDTVVFNTLNCGLYLLTGIEAAQPARAPAVVGVYDFGGQYCGVPTRLGPFWVQPIETGEKGERDAIVVLDLSDPARPTEVGRIDFAEGFAPHWTSPDREGERLVVTGYGEHLSRRVLMLRFDMKTGRVGLDTSFGDGDEYGPGLMVDRESWPHGETGPAMGHGAVFWPSPAARWPVR
jgi:hypothetical protein